MSCSLWFNQKKVLWNIKKLELYRDWVTIFVAICGTKWSTERYALPQGVVQSIARMN
jgi:hypothetical protein